MTSTSILLTTAFLPPVEYFIFMAVYGDVFIEKHENFNKQSYRNRCCIMSASGKLCLTVPVSKKGKSSITEIEISDHDDWRNIHWRTIESAYNASPFFLYYRDALGDVIHDKSQIYLFEFNMSLLDILIAEIGISCRVNFTNSYEKQPSGILDLRQDIHPKKPVDTYMNKYFNGPCPPYTRVFSQGDDFIPGLSIIDLLFNLGPETGSYLNHHAAGFRQDILP